MPELHLKCGCWRLLQVSVESERAAYPQTPSARLIERAKHIISDAFYLSRNDVPTESFCASMYLSWLQSSSIIKRHSVIHRRLQPMRPTWGAVPAPAPAPVPVTAMLLRLARGLSAAAEVAFVSFKGSAGRLGGGNSLLRCECGDRCSCVGPSEDTTSAKKNI